MDPQTGEKVVVGGADSFFFIPIRYRAPILIAAGVAFLFVVE